MATAITEDIRGDNNRSVVASSVELERSRCWFQRRCSWRPTSERLLEVAESRIWKFVKSHYEGKYVPVEKDEKIWTLKFNPNATKAPLVMIHGFGGGAGLWAMNIDALAKHRTVYAIDVLGFGRSSRPQLSGDPQEAEEQFVKSIEQWRQEIGLEKFVLLGHSFGGFLASSYALKHPSRVQHLILADSWGYSEKPEKLQYNIPTWVKIVATLIRPFNPLAGLRAAGPWGPSLVQKFRPDLQGKFAGLLEDDTIFNYIYHCNAQKPSGETAFKRMSEMYGWAKYPMIHRIGEMDKNIPMTMIHGSESWIDCSPSYQIKNSRSGYVDVQVITHAGHHVYADQPWAFNQAVNKVCHREDKLITVTIN